MVCQYLKTQLERTKKSLEKTFKDFETAAEFNLKIVNYLNITLNLNDGSLDLATNQKVLFSTLTKGLTTLLILLSTRQHLLKNGFLNNSFDEKIFQESGIYYEDKLNKAEYIDKVAYHAPSSSNQENKKKTRQRNVIWFNLPCSKSVTTRIG